MVSIRNPYVGTPRQPPILASSSSPFDTSVEYDPRRWGEAMQRFTDLNNGRTEIKDVWNRREEMENIREWLNKHLAEHDRQQKGGN